MELLERSVKATGMLIIASAYLFGAGGQPPSMEVKGLVDYCSQIVIPLILSCDVNASEGSPGHIVPNKCSGTDSELESPR